MNDVPCRRASKFIVEERERLGTDEAFWKKFSNAEGKRFSYQAILTHLQNERKARDQEDFHEAMCYFNGRLDGDEAGEAFKYKKAGVWYVCDSVDGIARRWRTLQADDRELAVHLETMRADGWPKVCSEQNTATA